jgi:hypothetical protein
MGDYDTLHDVPGRTVPNAPTPPEPAAVDPASTLPGLPVSAVSAKSEDPASTLPTLPKPAAPVDDLSTIAPDAPRPVATDSTTIGARPKSPRPTRAPYWIAGGILGVALIVIGAIVFWRPPTPEPKIDAPKAAANPKLAGPDGRLAEWVEAHGGHVVLGPDGFVLALELKDLPGVTEMPPFVHANALRELRLERCGITDTTVADLPEMPDLIRLSLAGNPVGDAAVAYLNRFPGVVDLDLNRTKITDSALDMLSNRATLKSLDVRGTAVTPVGVKRFAERVPACKLRSDVELAPPTVSRDLVVPEADGDRALALWALSKKGTVGLANPKKLVRTAAELPTGPFRVDEIKVTVKNGPLKMPAFAELAEITRFELTAPELTDADVAALGAMPKLWLFRVSGPITDAALPSVLRYPLLRYVGLSQTRMTDAGLTSVAKVPALENLRLVGSANVTDAGLAAFAGHKRLQTLDVTGCVGITDACVSRLEAIPMLSDLFVAKTRITQAGAAKLAEALPHCRIESDFGIVLPTK